MRHGLDTCFLVAYEIKDHPQYADSRNLFSRCISAGDDFALAPQVLAELVHILTDAKRFTLPLTINDALRRAEMWWTALETTQVFPTDAAFSTFVNWMATHQLGRKRILDTLLGATYHSAGITSLVTTNSRDFRIFDVFNIVEP
jgi:predicted nucleic acid-binding protein